MMDVYAMRLPGDVENGLFQELLSCVGPGKRERINQCRKESERIRMLFGDLLSRTAIMERTGLTNDEVSFAQNRYGKPYLKGWQGLHFNISHSGEWVAVAVDSRPVGIDVQEMAKIDLDVAKFFFAQDEYRDLMGSSDKVSYFYDLWTLKESYLKILGRGLSIPLDSFSIRFEENDIKAMAYGEELDEIFFTQYDIADGYKLALCATHDEVPQSVTMHRAERFYN